MTGKFRVVCARFGVHATIGLITTTIYFTYLVYVFLNRVYVSDGTNDLVFKLTGLPRWDQFASVGVIMISIYSSIVFHFLYSNDLLPKNKPRITQKPMVVLVSLVFLCALTSSAYSVFQDMHPRFLGPLYGWVFIVLCLYIAISGWVIPRIPSFTWQILAVVGLGVLAFFAFNFSLAGWFRSSSTIVQVFSSVVTAAVIASIILFAFIRLHIWHLVAFVLFLASIAPLISSISQDLASEPNSPVSLQHFKAIELESKPNIHIISLESLAPPELAKEYLKLHSVPYSTPLEDGRVTRFDNAFATQVPTKWSLNSVMALAQAGVPHSFEYFSGRKLSPMTSLLSKNGYHVVTGFPIMFLGAKGRYIDSYLPDPADDVLNSALCALSEASTVAFFGFCYLGAAFNDGSSNPHWSDQVIQLLEGYFAGPPDKPVFSYHHFLSPIGHTSLEFRTYDEADLEEFRQSFLPAARDAEQLIQRIIALAEDSEREAIIILTGDHGLWVSRTVEFTEEPDFFVQDRHGILLATLLNRTRCDEKALKHYMPDYSTPERLLLGLFRCLSANPEHMDKHFKFNEPYSFSEHLYHKPINS